MPLTIRLLILAVLIQLSCGARTAWSAETVSSVKAAYDLLQKGNLTESNHKSLQDFITKRFKNEKLTDGNQKHLVERSSDGGGYAFWVYESAQAKSIAVVTQTQRWPMTKLTGTNLFVAAEKFPDNTAANYRFDVDGVRYPIGGGKNRFGFESYPMHPDSIEQPGVAKGQLIDMGEHVGEKFYPGVKRNWWVYVPAGYDTRNAAQTRLILFHDGAGYCKGDRNACIVLDNLIAHKKIPLTIAVFVNPGTRSPAKPGQEGASNRGNEYDTCTPRYANFLDEEILPIVKEKYPFSPQAEHHAVCGASSGGSGAFTCGWFRPDLFGNVISFIGSFCDFRPFSAYPTPESTQLPTGDAFGPWKTAHDYPALLRKTHPRKPIRVFLQDGDNDLDNQLGHWFIANQDMAAALNYAGYDYEFVTGKGMHSSNHGKAILPEVLIWAFGEK